MKNLGVKYEGNVTEAEMLVLLEPLALVGCDSSLVALIFVWFNVII